jgi:hypothetical protein
LEGMVVLAVADKASASAATMEGSFFIIMVI